MTAQHSLFISTFHLESLGYSDSKHSDTNEDEQSSSQTNRGLHTEGRSGLPSSLDDSLGASLLLLTLADNPGLRVELCNFLLTDANIEVLSTVTFHWPGTDDVDDNEEVDQLN